MSSGNDVIHVGLDRDVTLPSPSNLLVVILFPFYLSIFPFLLLVLHRIASHPGPCIANLFCHPLGYPLDEIPPTGSLSSHPRKSNQEPQSQIQRNNTNSAQ
ncbi:hypothetical protein BO83DRAFT_34640 [Aspergillus eucalypticola CBS 122712]|uniref:Uncharacterized protein n=1 Tax=Aspergillus eucalypticola (strain CBS 122712 / IBT 29274) TaxID=1448314 RepID=A0A317VHU6_ASPEC|nr:uncharacterized protein BO83DRAFT_34640 [Aspergillus eucalypticola CBS 122712]PWY73485.1 hypothetical protein BO83DRAFT_34640 [Aspergillus eucalypticola CBS 122712]